MRELIKRLVPKPFIELYKKMRYMCITAMFNVFRIFPLDEGLVVLCNVWGFGDNTKYVALELLKRKKKQNIRIVFVTGNPEDENIPKGIEAVKTNTVRAVYALSRACVWVDCNRKEAYIKKRKGQFYIQTWHGGVPLKKIEGDCEEYLGEDYMKRAKWDSAMTDLYISNGGFCTDMYRRAFWYKGKVLECGTPRNDNLINVSNTRILSLRKKLNIPDNCELAIYAPTYRSGKQKNVYLSDIEELAGKLEEKFGVKYAVAVRLHPLCAAKEKGMYSYDRNNGAMIIDGNIYGDMYELMEAADVLVTDYSNTMFEFSMTGKKVFLYTPDFDEYEKERGMYFKPEELPFKTAGTVNELFENISRFDYTEYLARVSVFFEKLQLKESGNASKKTADYIVSYMKTYRGKQPGRGGKHPFFSTEMRC